MDAAIAPPTQRKIALVTGGASGIGLAIALDLARDHEVIALGRNPENLKALEGVPHIRPVSCELIDPDAREALVASLDHVDVLVHSAAVATPVTLESSNLEMWQSTFDINVFAAAELTRLCLPLLRISKGQVIFIGSGASTKAFPGHLVYSASKFALRAIADALRLEEVGAGIRVASVYPGPTDTPMNRKNRLATGGPDTLPEGNFSVPASHAAAVRLVVDAQPDSQVTEVTVRPRNL